MLPDPLATSSRNGATAATRKDVAFARVAAVASLRGLENVTAGMIVPAIAFPAGA